MTVVGRVAALCVSMVVGIAAPMFAQNTTTRVSVTSAGTQVTAGGGIPAVTADGRFVAFHTAGALIPEDTNTFEDVYVYDRLTSTLERVSLGPGNAQGNGGSRLPTISADGRFVAFASTATNLVSFDSNNVSDVFVRNRQTNTTTRVSMAPTGAGGPGSAEANGASNDAEISADGSHVVFTSAATNLVGNDTNDRRDTFVVNVQTRVVTRASVSSAGAELAVADAINGTISGDGRFVAFQTLAADAVPSDTNNALDVFLRDRQAGTTTRISVGPGGVQGNASSYFPRLSADGRFIVFTSDATNLDPGGRGVFVHDRQTGQTSGQVLDSGPNLLVRPLGYAISANGRYLCFEQDEAFNQDDDLYVFDRETRRKTQVNIATNGDRGNDGGLGCAMSGDGTVIAFASDSSNLVPNDTNSNYDTFVRTLLPEMAVDKTALTFAATTSGTTFVLQTAPQTVRLTQGGLGVATWTVTANQPWLQVTPVSGSGSGALTISVQPASGLPASGTVTGQIFVSLVGAVNTLPAIPVTLTLTPNGTTIGPFGTVDTPIDNRTGVTGAVPFTGWALDDVEVIRTSICRAAVGTEVAPVDPNCGGAAEIFVGFGVFIDGARPDVAGSFPAYPLATRAGWGFMVLTNFLPNQGNGTYVFRMRAQDREGNWTVLGARTMTCANATATLPFGTLDTPEQGGIASGTAFPSFGWALTPLPKTIPTDGSTIRVLVDGIDIGTADYNHARPDIQALFPGFNNTNGAVGFRILDTTTMTNGLHTISWAVTDNAGAIEGIGSRFFSVSNGVAAVTAAAASAAPSSSDLEALELNTAPIGGRRGWDLEAPVGWFGAGATGVTVIRSEEVSRVELQLGDGHTAGYLRTPAGLAPLPIGSRLDPANGTFTWAPGVGFVGPYHFVFVRSANGRAVSRREVRVILHPKGRGSVGPQVTIDTPSSNAIVREPFLLAGWAVDLDAATGTGVTTLHAWAYPAAGGAPLFLGATAYGGARPDVAAVHGAQFRDSGFGLMVQGLPAGDYDLALFAWSSETVGFVAPTIVRARVTP
jgi:Tol biopolymer transport system component